MPRLRNHEATPSNNLPIHPFQKNDPDTYTPPEKRDQLIALGMMLTKAEPQVGRRFAAQFLPMVEDALDDDPADAELWEFKGQTLLRLQRDLDALDAFAVGLSHAPDRETLLTYAAVTARNCGRTEDAQRYWERLAEVNPWNVQAQAMLTMRAAERDDWPKLKKHAEIWLELDPGNIEARQARVHYLLHDGERERAKEEFGKIESLHPKNLDELEQWYQHEVQ